MKAFVDASEHPSVVTATGIWRVDGVRVALCDACASSRKWTRMERLRAERWSDCGHCLIRRVVDATPRCLARIEALLAREPWSGPKWAEQELRLFLRFAVACYADSRAELWGGWLAHYGERYRVPFVNPSHPKLCLIAEHQTRDWILTAVTLVAEDAPDPAEGWF